MHYLKRRRSPQRNVVTWFQRTNQTAPSLLPEVPQGSHHRSHLMDPLASPAHGWFPAPPPPIYCCTLSPALVAKAREELQEKPEWRLRDVQALRDMILKEQPNLRTRLDDAFLLRFLRARKFDYDRALELLLNYHAGRKAWPEVFQDLKPSTVKHVLDLGFLSVLPHPDPSGRYILCLQPGKWKPNDYPFVDNVRALYLTLEKLIQPEDTQVNGIVILADYTGVGMSQASNPGPFLAKKVVSILQDGFPIRIKAVNIINEPRIFKGIFAIIKPFLKEKMAERYVLHGSDVRSLHRNIPPTVLPGQYGGSAAHLDMSAWSRMLLDCEEEFIVEFCQPDPLEGVVLPEDMLLEGEAGGGPEEDPFRAVRSQLYYCY
ncbi:alpha-tocopherol transfer protein-like isoform X1 [Gadus macrocephalus]|uniref:alpha-tocopherol transfer protein-like isoform X1 n=2 Tax=Gadus macrocephalus TaxID=80720 RepID=UPI0028CB1577|nr:alpha-tocopherol transfer protein-like isoform X1 [Gadus macrocephalus]